MANDILEQAKKRLAEVEEEAATLRRMIAAAEKGTVQVAPAHAPAPSYPPLPFVVPITPPPTIWITAPPKPDHGGACACPWCVPSCVPWICGSTTDKATFPPRYECQHNSACGCGCNGWLWLGHMASTTTTATLPLCLPSDSAIIYGKADGLAVDRTRYTGSVMLS